MLAKLGVRNFTLIDPDEVVFCGVRHACPQRRRDERPPLDRRSEQEICSLTDFLEGKLQRRSGSLVLSNPIARGLLLHLRADEVPNIAQGEKRVRADV
jgi:hypothetical protein